MEKSTQARRTFLKNLGCLTITIPMLPEGFRLLDQERTQEKLPGSLRHTPGLDAWIKILANNKVRIFSGKIELGQGIGTVIRQVAAEELMLELEDIDLIMADTSQTPNEGYTAGSGSVKGSAMAVRYAAATGRDYLLQMAAETFNEPLEGLTLDRGMIKSEQSNRQISFSELLADKQWNINAQANCRLIEKEQYRFVGKSVRSFNTVPVSKGEHLFIHDLTFPDMLHARVLRPPTMQSKLLTCNQERFAELTGHKMQLVVDGSFVAITGSKEYEVIKALNVLESLCTWENKVGPSQHLNFKEEIPNLVTDSESVVKTSTDTLTSKDETTTFQASFYKPYILHGSLGPACALAIFKDEFLTVWTHSQGVFPLREALSSLLALTTNRIKIVGIPGAGCFGHNCSDDAAAEAALLAVKLAGRHIKVSWTRTEENLWEARGSAMRMDIEVDIAKSGFIQAWRSNIYTDSHSTRPNKDPGTLLAARYLNDSRAMQGRGYMRGGVRNADPYYQIPNKDIKANFFKGPLRVSSLRSLGAYANIFAIESAMDEISHDLNEDPIKFRIKHLEDPRAIAVLAKIKEVTVDVAVGTNEGMGYAFSRYKNNDAYCAVACKARVNEQGKVTIPKFWVVVDVGEIINYDGVVQQMEGAVLQAASWTLVEEVHFTNGTSTDKNYDSYDVLRMQAVAEVAVFPISRPSEFPFGSGEAATPPTPAAITNAIFKATGKRIYHLPVGKQLVHR